MKEVIRAIRSGLSFYYLPDMDHGKRNSIFVPFFGVPAATLPMVSKLAKLTKAKVIWGIAETTPDGYTYASIGSFGEFFPRMTLRLIRFE